MKLHSLSSSHVPSPLLPVLGQAAKGALPLGLSCPCLLGLIFLSPFSEGALLATAVGEETGFLHQGERAGALGVTEE